ncbi:MAG: hypothetical protein Kow0062_04630 [Acidobacteriota bacterium]
MFRHAAPRAARRAACALLALTACSAFVLSGDTSCAPAVTACTQEEIDAIPVASIANMHWLMQVTPSGYSDFAIVTRPPFPRRDPRDPMGPAPLHEMLSGEWAAAVRYDGMGPIWLERCFRYPEWKTNSNFTIVEPPQFPDDPDGDGLNEGWSRIQNDHLDIRVEYDMEIAPDGVAMGKDAINVEQFETSNPFVLFVTYELTNRTMAPLTGLALYQLAHIHPGNTETGIVDIGWDPMMYPSGDFQQFQYDITGFSYNSGLIDGFATGSTFHDHVGFSADIMPAAFGLGSYRGHRPGDPGLPATGGMKPVEGEHCDIENEALAGETALFQDEAAGSMRFDLGDLAPGATTSLRLMFSIQTRASGVPAESCLRVVDDTGPCPEIRIARGPCISPGPGAGPFDIVMGSLYDLQIVPGCDPAFDCVQLTSLVCLAQGHTSTDLTLAEDGHASDSLFYLVRRSGRFTSWGQGQPATGQPPLERFFFTPSTAPGVDACDVIP